MRVLLLNTYDLRGGAARATWRLFQGLKLLPVEPILLVQEKRSNDPGVIRASSPISGLLNPFRPYLDFAIPLLQTRQRVLFSTALIPDQIIDLINQLKPDVVHLNWITGGFIRLENLAKIKCPVVWTLHDMWAFTGGCHNTVDCTRYLTECGICPLLHSTSQNDLSRRVYLRKQETYSRIGNMIITAPSRWLADRILASPLLGNRKVEVVANGLDTLSFQPLDKQHARQRQSLPPNKKIVAFGAIRATETPLKGFKLLVEALKSLNRKDIMLVVFGSTGPGNVDVSGLDVMFKGPVDDHEILVDLYSGADLVAVPSYQEVFGQAASEAMACGTPVVAFACTGLLDIVKHKETGYLAEPYNPEDLAAGIQWILEDEERHHQLCQASRDRAVEHFDMNKIAKQFMQIYQEILNGKKS
jgi:glycosyltransferase involved in cell wall biosynthesis